MRRSRIYLTGFKKRIENFRFRTSDKLLIIQYNALGDATLMIQYAIKMKQMGYYFDILCYKGLLPLWRYFFPDHNIEELQGKNWNVKYLKKHYSYFLNQSYKSIICYSSNTYSLYLATLCKHRRIITMTDFGSIKLSLLLFSRFYMAKRNEHFTTRIKHMLLLAKIEIKEEKKRNLDTEGDYVLLHPGAKWAMRRWNPKKYLQLAYKIILNGYECAVLLHESEIDLIEFFRKKSNHKAISLIITKDIEDLIVAVNDCFLFVGNDSGPAHLANLMTKPTICIWGPGDLHRIRPIGDNVSLLYTEMDCRPCDQYSSDIPCKGRNDCLESIAVNKVYNKVNETFRNQGMFDL